MNFQESVGGGARACGAATSNQSRTCFLFQYHGSNEVHPGSPGPARSLSLDRGRASQQLGVITSAINSFSASTCIRFIPRTTETAYVNIQSYNGCYSYVGRQGNAQTVSLMSNGCIYFGTVQHELIHALGFDHEQCRSDRDQHIQVLLQNVISGMEYNFNKINTLNQGTPYDYSSVMHYGRLAFSKDIVSPTMVAVPDPNAVFGTAKQMSQNDIRRINLLYCSN
ncbi:hypothetical protein Q5P01_012993 [Channa striata]|uniref:Metalloendopeptidase n=1 Tax=Channa striata TaxID=64152 RepID=A0AA88MTJ2_CHASR|nr:hypothetical protein Q5P01_012993 [Channa striata]